MGQPHEGGKVRFASFNPRVSPSRSALNEGGAFRSTQSQARRHSPTHFDLFLAPLQLLLHARLHWVTAAETPPPVPSPSSPSENFSPARSSAGSSGRAWLGDQARRQPQAPVAGAGVSPRGRTPCITRLSTITSAQPMTLNQR